MMETFEGLKTASPESWPRTYLGRYLRPQYFEEFNSIWKQVTIKTSHESSDQFIYKLAQNNTGFSDIFSDF